MRWGRFGPHLRRLQSSRDQRRSDRTCRRAGHRAEPTRLVRRFQHGLERTLVQDTLRSTTLEHAGDEPGDSLLAPPQLFIFFFFLFSSHSPPAAARQGLHTVRSTLSPGLRPRGIDRCATRRRRAPAAHSARRRPRRARRGSPPCVARLSASERTDPGVSDSFGAIPTWRTARRRAPGRRRPSRAPEPLIGPGSSSVSSFPTHCPAARSSSNHSSRSPVRSRSSSAAELADALVDACGISPRGRPSGRVGVETAREPERGAAVPGLIRRRTVRARRRTAGAGSRRLPAAKKAERTARAGTHAVRHRSVQLLPAPGALPREQRGENRERGDQPAARVVGQQVLRDRRLPVRPRTGRERPPGRCSRDRGRAGPRRPRLAVARQRAMDEPRIELERDG